MKVSFFVEDLSTNAIVRSCSLATALKYAGFDIEVLGFLQSGHEIYFPYRELFEYKTIHVKGKLRGHIRKLAHLAIGDIIYACKPLITTFLPALFASGFGKSRPLLLDVEDDEFWIPKTSNGHVFDNRNYNLVNKIEKLWKQRYIYALHPFTKMAWAVTVVSSRLKKSYGGKIILHGPDEKLYNPEYFAKDKPDLRNVYGLPPEVPILLFAGVPHYHKGLDVLAEAMQDPRLASLHLVVAGPSEHPGLITVKETLGSRLTLLGLIPQSEMPRLLATVDIIPTPQLDNDFTQAQIPAKLLEGMAMAKACVASRVSDISAILGENTQQPRGWCHEPGDPIGLAEALVDIITRPIEVSQRSEAARGYYLENASVNAIHGRLQPIIENCLQQKNNGNIYRNAN